MASQMLLHVDSNPDNPSDNQTRYRPNKTRKQVYLRLTCRILDDTAGSSVKIGMDVQITCNEDVDILKVIQLLTLLLTLFS